MCEDADTTDRRNETMDSIGDVWSAAADKWDEVIGQVGDDDWEKSTPL